MYFCKNTICHTHLELVTEQTTWSIKEALAAASVESVCCLVFAVLWFQAHQVETWLKYLR